MPTKAERKPRTKKLLDEVAAILDDVLSPADLQRQAAHNAASELWRNWSDAAFDGSDIEQLLSDVEEVRDLLDEYKRTVKVHLAGMTAHDRALIAAERAA